MPLKRCQRVLFVVLRADGEDDAAPRKLQGIALQGNMGLTDGAALPQHNAFQSIIADHAAPQRVVQVQHQAFRTEAF